MTPGTQPAPNIVGPPGTEPIPSPLQGTIIQILVEEGGRRSPVGQQMFVMDSMKMEHIINSDIGGFLRQLTVAVGDVVYEGHPLAFIEEADVGDAITEEASNRDRPRLHPPPTCKSCSTTSPPARTENRKAWVDRRHAKGKLTQRESLAELVDPGTWVEMGELVLPGPTPDHVDRGNASPRPRRRHDHRNRHGQRKPVRRAARDPPSSPCTTKPSGPAPRA